MELEEIINARPSEIKKLAKKYKISLDEGYPLSKILLSAEKKEDLLLADGELEIMPDGYGFLRGSSLGQDVYVPASQVKKLGLRSADYIVSVIRTPMGSEKNYAIQKILLINDETLEKARHRPRFDDLAPHYPDEKIKLGDRVSCRIVDLVAPIGRGQRGLIVAPPKAGKTVLISELANGIIENNPDIDVWVLLVDERPEEVTDIKHNVKGATVFASTFDEDPHHHVEVTEHVLERAKRAVEYGKHVLILVDNITRMARAYNLVVPSSGKLVSGGLDPHAFIVPKKFFGAARNIKKGGSLTILATALVDTGSRMDDVVYEEFKGTGNSEIHLDRAAAEMRIFPAINIKKSGTRKEELFYSKEELEAIYNMRRYLINNFSDIEAIRKLIDFIKSEKNNDLILYRFINNS